MESTVAEKRTVCRTIGRCSARAINRTLSWRSWPFSCTRWYWRRIIWPWSKRRIAIRYCQVPWASNVFSAIDELSHIGSFTRIFFQATHNQSLQTRTRVSIKGLKFMAKNFCHHGRLCGTGKHRLEMYYLINCASKCPNINFECVVSWNCYLSITIYTTHCLQITPGPYTEAFLFLIEQL